MTQGWLQPRKVAQHLDCTRRYVYELVALGELEAIKLGPRAIRISELSMKGFIAKMKLKSLEKK